MENIKNISMRDALWNRVYEIAKDDKDVVIVSADMGAPSLDKFRKDFSSQFVDVGIAEANATLVAAGLALEGKKVFTYAIAPFITLRCYEQIRVQMAIMKIPITVVGVGAGFSYDDSGPTHHTLEDLSVMRSLPNLVVHSPSDSVMAAYFAGVSCKGKEPTYLRLDRQILPNIYPEGKDFSSGLEVLGEDGELCIIATGNMVHRALEVSKELKNHSVKAKVIDLHTFPIKRKSFLKALEGVKKIVTLEEHFLTAAMGGAVAEFLIDNNLSIPVKRIGLKHEDGYCYNYGGRANIQSLYGLDKESITKSILDWK